MTAGAVRLAVAQPPSGMKGGGVARAGKAHCTGPSSIN